jgi:endonuclease/exonuclease/phosphatase (EEP) superfamily protein YafD
VRIASWNCCLKFADNLHHLLDQDVDVAVVCEAQELQAWPLAASGRALTGLSRAVGQEDVKHLAVVASAPWTVRDHPDLESAPPWTLPVRIEGPVSFTLLAIWPVRKPGWPCDYVEQIDLAVDWLEKQLHGEPLVFAGDFNAPIKDSLKRYVRVAERLSSMGLDDAYLRSRSLDLSQAATEWTYFHGWRRESGFHIDHVMLPSAWADEAKVTIGDFDTWVASGRSDHVPVVVDLPSL